MKMGVIEQSWYVTSQYMYIFLLVLHGNGVDVITTSDNRILGSLRRYNTTPLGESTLYVMYIGY